MREWAYSAREELLSTPLTAPGLPGAYRHGAAAAPAPASRAAPCVFLGWRNGQRVVGTRAFEPTGNLVLDCDTGTVEAPLRGPRSGAALRGDGRGRLPAHDGEPPRAAHAVGALTARSGAAPGEKRWSTRASTPRGSGPATRRAPAAGRPAAPRLVHLQPAAQRAGAGELQVRQARGGDEARVEAEHLAQRAAEGDAVHHLRRRRCSRCRPACARPAPPASRPRCRRGWARRTGPRRASPAAPSRARPPARRRSWGGPPAASRTPPRCGRWRSRARSTRAACSPMCLVMA